MVEQFKSGPWHQLFLEKHSAKFFPLAVLNLNPPE
jgi:hypothetical protein